MVWPVELPGLVVAIGLAMLVGIWVAVRTAAWSRRRHGRRRSRRGLAAERAALRLLERRGYRVVATQVRGRCRMLVDGVPIDHEIVADAIVRKRRCTYVAEIKTGRGASVAHRATRRQLLEYALCYGGDGVLLVDATRRTIAHVRFVGLGESVPRDATGGRFGPP